MFLKGALESVPADIHDLARHVVIAFEADLSRCLLELHIETDEQLELRLAITFAENRKLRFSKCIEHDAPGFEDFS